MRLRWCIHQKEKSTAGRKIRQFNFQLRARSKAVGGSTRLIERARLPSSRRRFVFPFVPKGRGGGGAFDSSRKRKKEISSSINRFRPTDETVDGTIRIEITPTSPVDDGIGIIYKVGQGYLQLLRYNAPPRQRCMPDLCDVYTRARLLIRLSDNSPAPRHNRSTASRCLKAKLLFVR